MKAFISIFFCILALNLAAQCPGPAQRNALLNLERSVIVEGSRAGQVPVTDTCGNQRYAQYTEINPTPIAYVPTATGNPSTNYSEFVTDPSGDIWYIDWQGRGLQLTGGGSTCDQDWLQISDNSCPNSLLDSIYKYKYASIGARLVWPGAELLVNDSTASGIAVIQGSRNARLALYDSGAPGTFLMIDHGGTTPVVYMPVSSNLVFKTTAGTPQTPVGSQVSHFAINTQDSTIQMFQYPRTRVDTQSIVNFLYTDPVGKIRSRPAADLITSGGGTTGSGIANRVTYWGSTTSLTSNATFTFTPSASATNPHLRVRSSTTQFQPVIRADSLAADGIGFQARAFGTSGSEYNALLGVSNATTGTQDINIELQNLSTNPGAYANIDLFSSGGGSLSKYRTTSSTFFNGNDAGSFRINWTNTDAFSTAGFNLSSTTNNVGIGAASPGSKFYVSGSTRFDLGSDATGDIFYRAAGGNLTRLPIGSTGDVLTVAAGLPSWASAGGGGTVTSFSSGNLSPLFTTSVATATTTPALSFTLSNQTANTVFAGPTSGGAAAPTFRALVAADIPSSAAGDFFKDGGNSFGAAATLGTNDNNALSIETNNVTRATVTTGASTGGAWTATNVTANTNTATEIVTYQVNSTGTAANDFGHSLLFQAESSTTDNRDQAKFTTGWTTATDASLGSKVGIHLRKKGSALAEVFQMNRSTNTAGAILLGSSNAVTIMPNGITNAQAFTVGNSSSPVSIGGSSGAIDVTTSSSSNGAININSSSNIATSAGAINFGDGNVFTQTSGTRTYIRVPYNFSPTSGTAVHNQLGFTGVINQTGGANGITRGIRLGKTLPSVADSRAIEISENNANAKGIYQTGSSTTNNLVGFTAFGSTSAPGTAVDVTGTTSTEHLIGQNLTPTIAVNTGGAGTGASASMTNAQSSDLAGRFSITSGTGATTGLWATITFDDAFAVAPIVQFDCEDQDCANLRWYSNTSTTSTEFFIASGQADGTVYEINFHIIGGK